VLPIIINNIAKDNPDILIHMAQQDLGQNHNRDKIFTRTCSILLKQSNSTLLLLFGFTPPPHIKFHNFNL
jgi:hypothetical protein